MVWAAETNIKGPKGDKGDPGASGAATCFMSDTAPVGKPPGSLWWETDTGYLYAYYDDGTSTQWVMVSPGSGGISQADADLRYVNVTGDTMTGDLTVGKSNPRLILDRTDGFNAVFRGSKAGLTRWQLVMGNSTAETGGNAGSDLSFTPFDDAGAGGLATALTLYRKTGVADFAVKPTVAGQVWAAPFDALAYNGMQINGGFEVNQPGVSGIATSGTYFCDGWRLIFQGAFGANASAAAWAAPKPFIGYITFTSGLPATPSTEFLSIQQQIEGYRTVKLGWGTVEAQPITIGFVSAHHRPGTYSVVVRNAAATRSYACTYTQNASDTFEWKTVTIPGCTDGAWNYTNGAGLLVDFTIACGPIYTAPSANAWVNGNYVAAPGQVNGGAATSDVVRLGHVVVLPGIEAPPAARAPLIMRPYDQELLTCKRYYQHFDNTNSGSMGSGVATSATAFDRVVLPLTMGLRAVPTLTYSGSGLFVYDGSALPAVSSVALITASYNLMSFSGVCASGLTVGRAACCMWAGTGSLKIDARL